MKGTESIKPNFKQLREMLPQQEWTMHKYVIAPTVVLKCIMEFWRMKGNLSKITF
jgi:hypothetical protein